VKVKPDRCEAIYTINFSGPLLNDNEEYQCIYQVGHDGPHCGIGKIGNIYYHLWWGHKEFRVMPNDPLGEA
jgi:hypothetical protein